MPAPPRVVPPPPPPPPQPFPFPSRAPRPSRPPPPPSPPRSAPRRARRAAPACTEDARVLLRQEGAGGQVPAALPRLAQPSPGSGEGTQRQAGGDGPGVGGWGGGGDDDTHTRTTTRRGPVRLGLMQCCWDAAELLVWGWDEDGEEEEGAFWGWQGRVGVWGGGGGLFVSPLAPRNCVSRLRGWHGAVGTTRGVSCIPWCAQPRASLPTCPPLPARPLRVPGTPTHAPASRGAASPTGGTAPSSPPSG